MSKKYNMYLELGDTSNDGHGKTQRILLESNTLIREIRKAYKDSCKLTGVSLHSCMDKDFTGLKRGWKESSKYEVAVEFEEPNIPREALEILKKFGLTFEIVDEGSLEIEEWDSKTKPLDLYYDNFIALWIWFVKLSNPKIELKEIKDVIPTINDDDLDVYFGYGLFN